MLCVILRAVASRLRGLAFLVSSLALPVSSGAFLGLMQAEGGLFDSCMSYSFVDVSFEKCREIGASIVQAGEAEQQCRSEARWGDLFRGVEGAKDGGGS